MKRVLSLTLIIFALMLSACAKDPFEGLSVRGGGVVCYAYWVYGVEDLESYADAVVEGKLSNPQQITPPETEGFGNVAYTLAISKVHMGDFEKGDQITIAEHYYVREVNGDRFLQTTDGYLPSSLKETYLFFLILNDQNEESTLFGIYTPVCGVMGRHPLTGDPADLRLGESAPRDYGSLHKKVLAKYGDEK